MLLLEGIHSVQRGERVVCDSLLSSSFFSSVFFWGGHGVSIIQNTIQISAGGLSWGSWEGRGSRFSPCPHYQKTRRAPANQCKRLRQAMPGGGTYICVCMCVFSCTRCMLRMSETSFGRVCLHLIILRQQKAGANPVV